MIDLHIHTTASSDGQHTPEEIFVMARELGLKALAFADHNTAAGITKGLELSEKTGIEFLPCIEINSTYDDMDLHLLAYGIDPDSGPFKEWMTRIEAGKWAQSRERLEKLNNIGFVLDWEDVMKVSEGRIPTGNSYLKALLSRPENKGDKRLMEFVDGDRSDSPYLNFYLDYFKGGSPAFVPLKETMSVETIAKIKDLGAIPVLAHPSDTPDETVGRLIESGLMGLEVYSTYHDEESTAHFLETAKSHNLLITAGSDFHGEAIKPGIKLGGIPCKSYELFEALKEAIKNQLGS